MTQCRQVVRSIKPKPSPASRPSSVVELPLPADFEPIPANENEVNINELHVEVVHISKLYTDNTERFPIRSRSGNQYMMITYHCNGNVILACPFKTCKNKHHLEAYNSIMARLSEKELDVNLQILDNEASKAYCDLITKKWKHKFQAEMTLNFLLNAKRNKRMLAWEFFSGLFDYDAAPLGSLGARVITHNKPSIRTNAWDFRGKDGWSIGAAMLHYLSQQYVSCAMHEERVNYTV
ncbi:hypothetical protein ACHAWF_006544 [Thalassiosira exigua]